MASFQLIGNWVSGIPNGVKYPISIAEAHGAVIGTKFLIVSGFLNGFNDATEKSYCIDSQNPGEGWLPKDILTDDLSLEGTALSQGITHAGFVAVGSKMYLCGGVRCPALC